MLHSCVCYLPRPGLAGRAIGFLSPISPPPPPPSAERIWARRGVNGNPAINSYSNASLAQQQLFETQILGRGCDYKPKSHWSSSSWAGWVTRPAAIRSYHTNNLGGGSGPVVAMLKPFPGASDSTDRRAVFEAIAANSVMEGKTATQWFTDLANNILAAGFTVAAPLICNMWHEWNIKSGMWFGWQAGRIQSANTCRSAMHRFYDVTKAICGDAVLWNLGAIQIDGLYGFSSWDEVFTWLPDANKTDFVGGDFYFGSGSFGLGKPNPTTAQQQTVWGQLTASNGPLTKLLAYADSTTPKRGIWFPELAFSRLAAAGSPYDGWHTSPWMSDAFAKWIRDNGAWATFFNTSYTDGDSRVIDGSAEETAIRTYFAAASPPPPPPPPPPTDKPTTGYGITGLPLQLVYQDQWHVADPADIANDLWGAASGVRQQNVISASYPTSNTVRMATVTEGGKPARRVLECRLPQNAWWGRENTQHYAGAGYSEMGLAVDVFIPADFAYTSVARGSNLNGKTHIGLRIGPDDGGNAAYTSEGGSLYPWQQTNGACHVGLNFTSTASEVRFSPYSHYLRRSGLALARTNGNGSGGVNDASIAIPKGRWVTVEMYVKLDTNGQNGYFRCWLTDGATTTLWVNLSDVDFGGMAGVRDYPNLGKFSAFSWGTTPQALTVAAGNRIRGLMGRHMPGGANGSDTTDQRNNWWNTSATGRWYLYNWRTWG